MLIPLVQILYFIVLGMMALLSIFIVYHIIFYSYSTFSKLVTLALFISVAGVLFLTNFLLFTQLPLEDIFSKVMY
ncbi:MAG TPA: hypothetical protein VF817_01205 [Patescibacteria group bacterium]